jgi:hypothetical protein
LNSEVTNNAVSGADGYGGGISSENVVSAPAALVTVNGTFIGGNAAFSGGGIANGATLNLVDYTQVNKNTASVGGGIYNTGVVNLSGGSQVDHNVATTNGGGIFNVGTDNGVTSQNVEGNSPNNVAV